MSATKDREIERLARERDLARQVAEEAMRLLPDEGLAELRRRLDGDDHDGAERDPGPTSEQDAPGG